MSGADRNGFPLIEDLARLQSSAGTDLTDEDPKKPSGSRTLKWPTSALTRNLLLPSPEYLQGARWTSCLTRVWRGHEFGGSMIQGQILPPGPAEGAISRAGSNLSRYQQENRTFPAGIRQTSAVSYSYPTLATNSSSPTFSCQHHFLHLTLNRNPLFLIPILISNMATAKDNKSKASVKSGPDKHAQKKHNTRQAANATQKPKQVPGFKEPPLAPDHLTQPVPTAKYPYVNNEGRTTFDRRYVINLKAVAHKPKKKSKRAPERRLLGNEDVGASFFAEEIAKLLVSDAGAVSDH